MLSTTPQKNNAKKRKSYETHQKILVDLICIHLGLVCLDLFWIVGEFSKLRYVFKGFCFSGFAAAHYSKSQIFVQKFNLDKTPTFSRVLHPNFF